jgi:asparagine synthase (glutamine-hydrolysing)
MCGLAGFMVRDAGDGELMRQRAERMANQIAHRGPDDAGQWVDTEWGVALAHRRLSILDLSPAGHQPMRSACGRFVLVFNGEIYNHMALRAQLESGGGAQAWRGHSDTETLLACVAAWGVTRTLQAAVGMFAIALWDRTEHVLVLARDRLGEKPLYYGWQGATFLFGSETKALQAHPDFSASVDRGALALLLRHNCIPAPYSIHAGILKLPPGCLLRIHARSLEAAGVPEAYWTLNDTLAAGLADPFAGSDLEATDALESQLRQSIAAQMLADVPLGAFLSGGIDSSTVVALMQAQSERPVRTFTIGLGEGAYDEARHAAAVAAHLGTDHTELRIHADDALAVIPRLPQIYCEPFADSSQIPTFLVSQLACRHVKVALSGDGGDELFGGYNRYLGARRIWSRLQYLPRPLRATLGRMLLAVSPAAWNGVFDAIAPLLPARARIALPGEKAHKLARVLSAGDGHAYYRGLTSQWPDPGAVVIGATEPPTRLTDRTTWPAADSFEHWMMAMDAQTYLPDDILAKVDRAAMANSLETRVPLLDHRVVALAWRMPMRFKIRDGEGKWLLRQVLYRHVPRAMVDRPKMGFGIPLDAWLRGPLRAWAEELLCARRLADEGYFHPGPVRAMWEQHLVGSRNWQHHLWPILMFQAWLPGLSPPTAERGT